MNLPVLIRNAGSSVAQVILSAVLLFALYRVLTHYLTVAQVGLWSLVMASTSIARLSEFGLGGGVVRFIAHDLGRGDTKRAARTLFMGLILIACLVSVTAVALYPVFLGALRSTLPKEELADALILLPYAVAALAVGTVGNVFLSALDGCQRSDLRAVIQLSGSFVQLGAAMLLVPSQGLASLGPIQLLQSGVISIFSGIAAALCLKQPLGDWLGWDKSRLRELIRYGGSMQVAAVGQLLYDPTVKMFLAVFGGLAFTGYYEMANRMMLQFRSVIVAAFNALVPFIAERTGRDHMDEQSVRNAYLKSCQLLIAVASPYYAIIGAALPLLLTFWLGRFELHFIWIGFICWMGWTANTMVAPAYFLYLALGRLRWTVWSQFAIGSLNLILAWLGGKIAGGIGVVAGSAAALAAGSLVTLVAFHYDYRVHLKDLVPFRSMILLLVSATAAAISITFYLAWKPSPSMANLLAGPLILTVLLISMSWKQPVLSELLSKIRVSNR